MIATVKERPILVAQPLINPILDGSKTQTRRIIKPAPSWVEIPQMYGGGGIWAWQRNKANLEIHPDDWPRFCPYGRPGDRLWVRETWQHVHGHDEYESWELPHIKSFVVDGVLSSPALLTKPTFGKTWYKADQWAQEYHKEDQECGNKWNWRPSIHMPRWASRILLEITSVRVERLQDISPSDAMAEGFKKITKDNGITWKYGMADFDGLPGEDDMGWCWREWDTDPIEAYRKLWESLNGPGSWEKNPWLWCLEFRLIP